MKRVDIEKAAEQHAFSQTPDARERYLLSKGFKDGAKWRIDSVWHKPNEEPIKLCDLLLIEQTDGEFELGYRFDAAKTRRWAFVKDLLPIK